MGQFPRKNAERVRLYCSAHARELFWSAIIFLVSTASFSVGYIACRRFNHAPIIIEECAPQDRIVSGSDNTNTHQ